MAELYDFQKQSVAQLLSGKHIIVSSTGSGKTAMGANWIAEQVARTGKRDVLIVTTASKARTSDWEDELRLWHPSLLDSLSSLSTLSWHKLRAWEQEHHSEIEKYIIVWDEIQKASAGVSSGMGKAFLKITKQTRDWAAFTATPGDTWLKFYPYLVACDLEWNKTSFLRKYANVQTYKGYPEIVGWRNEDELRDKWASISYAPDTTQVMSELPPETHKVVEFKKPSAYNKVMKTRTSVDGEFLDTSGALCAELRRLCFTKEKCEWVKEFIEGLGDGAVVFYNFIKTGDELEEIITKALPKGARVWRIDGRHHEIPTAETIGKYDIVLCQWQSGSEALNLQMLHYWVSVEACYSYSTSVQARGRIKRIGQQNSMFYYYLKTPGTIEDAIYDALRNKSEFSERNWAIENNLIEGEEE